MSFDFVSSCCVCKLNVDDLKGKKRLKKLNGKACVAERSRCVKERCGVSIDNIGLKDSKCVVCYQCTLILGKIAKYNKEIEKLTDLVVKSFQAQSDGEVNSDSAHASQEERTPKRRKVIVSFC